MPDKLEVFGCEQGTPEWHECRKAIVTASEMSAVMAKGRNGGESLTRAKYMRRLAAELITGELCAGWEGNADTERGHELEAEARRLYSLQTGNQVQQLGFMKLGRLGYSPDGLVDEDGLAEIKCPRPDIQIERLLGAEIPTEYKLQMQTGMAVSGRKYCDFVSYAKGLPLFVQRFARDEGQIFLIRESVVSFNTELDALVARVKSFA